MRLTYPRFQVKAGASELLKGKGVKPHDRHGFFYAYKFLQFAFRGKIAPCTLVCVENMLNINRSILFLLF